MFGLFYGLYKYLTEKPEYHVLMLGVDGSGKTALLEQIKSIATTTRPALLRSNMLKPTVGLNIGKVENSSHRVIFWDLGGQVGLRTLQWPKYFGETQMLFFVVDASANEEKLEESKETFLQLMQHKQLEETTTLILANKSDLQSAKTAQQIKDFLTKDKIFTQKIDCLAVSATSGDGVGALLNYVSVNINKKI